MSASAEELSSQAEHLKEMISVFDIGDDDNMQYEYRETGIEILANDEKIEEGYKPDLADDDEKDNSFESY